MQEVEGKLARVVGVVQLVLAAALGGELGGADFAPEPFFGLQIPRSVPGVPAAILDPRAAWADKGAYDAAARTLAGLFRQNFGRFEGGVDPAVTASLPPE